MKLTSLEIEDKIKTLIFEESKLYTGIVKPASKEEILDTLELKKDLGFDSIDVIEFVMLLEVEFNENEIFLSDEDFDKTKSVQDFVNVVLKLKGF
jgi:acyl carrier protein